MPPLTVEFIKHATGLFDEVPLGHSMDMDGYGWIWARLHCDATFYHFLASLGISDCPTPPDSPGECLSGNPEQSLLGVNTLYVIASNQFMGSQSRYIVSVFLCCDVTVYTVVAFGCLGFWMPFVSVVLLQPRKYPKGKVSFVHSELG